MALAIGTNKTIDDPSRWKFNGEGYWFKSAEEMVAAAEAGNIPIEAVENAAAEIRHRSRRKAD
jgi:DNA polymerase III alpha subunit